MADRLMKTLAEKWFWTAINDVEEHVNEELLDYEVMIEGFRDAVGTTIRNVGVASLPR
jgi:hypothetical protein